MAVSVKIGLTSMVVSPGSRAMIQVADLDDTWEVEAGAQRCRIVHLPSSWCFLFELRHKVLVGLASSGIGGYTWRPSGPFHSVKANMLHSQRGTWLHRKSSMQPGADSYWFAGKGFLLL